MNRKAKIGLTILALSVGVPFRGEAVTTLFPANDLSPSIGDRNFFSVSSSQNLYRFQFAFDLSNTYIFQPLDTTNPDGTRLRSVIDYAFGHFFSGGIGITDFWQFGFSLPVYSRARFQVPDADSTAGAENVFELGDVRIASKVRLLDSNRYRWGAAVEPFVTIPLGGDDHYLGETKVTGGLKAIGDFLITDRIRLAMNLGAQIRGERVTISNIDYRHRFLTGLGVSGRLGRGITVSAEAQANTALDNFFADRDTTPLEFIAGAQWEIGSTGLRVGIGGGSCGICGAGGAKARTFLNVGYFRQDEGYALQEKEEERMRVVTLGGSAEPVLEAFEVYELVDKCPVDVGDYRIGRDDPRCTEVYELQSIADACPDAETFNPKLDNPKCLQIYTLRGQDSDQDGVPDFLDRCPTEPGSRRAEGCPSAAFAIVSPEEGQILTQKINFEFGKSTLREDAKEILSIVAGAIHSYPSILSLSIEGHTDTIGTEAQNQALSYSRARTVYRFLVDHGINPERLTYKGFGTKRPISDNKTEEGRAQNRRVEFLIKKVGNLPGQGILDTPPTSGEVEAPPELPVPPAPLESEEPPSREPQLEAPSEESPEPVSE